MKTLDSYPAESLLTITQAAELKRVNRSSVQKAIQTRRLPSIKIGSVYLVPRESVERWVLVGHRPRKVNPVP